MKERQGVNERPSQAINNPPWLLAVYPSSLTISVRSTWSFRVAVRPAASTLLRARAREGSVDQSDAAVGPSFAWFAARMHG